MEFYPFPPLLFKFLVFLGKKEKNAGGPKAIMQLLGEGKAVNS